MSFKMTKFLLQNVLKVGKTGTELSLEPNLVKYKINYLILQSQNDSIEKTLLVELDEKK